MKRDNVTGLWTLSDRELRRIRSRGFRRIAGGAFGGSAFHGLKSQNAGLYYLPTSPGAATVAPASGVADVVGAWAQITAGVASAIYVVGIAILQVNGNTLYVHYDIGTGAAGSEVVVGSARLSQVSLVGEVPPIPLPIWIAIPANTRISIRSADNTGVANNHYLSLWVINQSDVVPI